MNLRRLLSIGGGLYCLYIVIALVLVLLGLRWVFGLYSRVLDATGTPY